MKRAVTAVLFILLSMLPATASDHSSTLSEQIVVNRATKDRAVQAYVILTRDSIQRAWKVPSQLAHGGSPASRISITYVVNRDGGLESAELIRGSGDQEIDRTVMEAIRSAAPFPRFPETIAAGKMCIKAKFVVGRPPTNTITRVDAKVGNEDRVDDTSSESARNKFKWGVPAEASSSEPRTVVVEQIPPQPVTPKYRWGHNQ